MTGAGSGTHEMAGGLLNGCAVMVADVVAVWPRSSVAVKSRMLLPGSLGVHEKTLTRGDAPDIGSDGVSSASTGTPEVVSVTDRFDTTPTVKDTGSPTWTSISSGSVSASSLMIGGGPSVRTSESRVSTATPLPRASSTVYCVARRP